MAKGFKSGGKDFKPGISGNPKGGPKIPEEVKILRKLTIDKLQEIADLILAGDRPTLQELANSHTESAIRVAYARAALNAMQKGDLSMIEVILNRLIGKPKENLVLSNDKDSPLNFTDTEKAAKLAAILASAQSRKGK